MRIFILAVLTLTMVFLPCIPARAADGYPVYNPGFAKSYRYGLQEGRFGYGTRYGYGDRFGHITDHVSRFGPDATRYGFGTRFGYMPELYRVPAPDLAGRAARLFDQPRPAAESFGLTGPATPAPEKVDRYKPYADRPAARAATTRPAPRLPVGRQSPATQP